MNCAALRQREDPAMKVRKRTRDLLKQFNRSDRVAQVTAGDRF